MIRSEIMARFREECPEIPTRVISDTVLYSWCELADKEFCAETRCIVDQDGTEWNTAVNDTNYNLSTKITSFYDIDDTYASGVVYDGKPLTKTTMAGLDLDSTSWRARDAGTPKKWYRRGNFLYLDRPAATAALKVKVYSVLLSDDWTTDVAPFNQLAYLEPFHEAILLNLIARAKAKVAKGQEAQAALAMYTAFVKWSKGQLLGNKGGPIYFRRGQAPGR